MNKRGKLALVVLPLVVLSAALGWARWKWDNPTPTAQDLEIRSNFLHATEATVQSSGISHNSAYAGVAYELTPQDRKDIAAHLWLTKERTWAPSYPYIVFVWGGGSTSGGIRIYRSDKPIDYYGDAPFETPILIHPATSRYLNQWLAEHPQVGAKLGLNE